MKIKFSKNSNFVKNNLKNEYSDYVFKQNFLKIKFGLKTIVPTEQLRVFKNAIYTFDHIFGSENSKNVNIRQFRKKSPK